MVGSRKLRRRLCLATAAVACATAGRATAQLAVDMNGGSPAGPNLGWDGTTNQPVNGVTWQPWGGTTTLGGDGTQLPFTGTASQGITKTFTTGIATSGAVTVSLTSAANGANGSTLNSRDRGSPAGTNNNGDLYRDFVFLSRDTGTGIGGTPLVISLSGLNKNTTYRFTAYANDSFNLGQYVFGEVNPRPFDYQPAPTAPPEVEQDENNGIFANPPTPLDGTLIGPRVTSGSALLQVTSAEEFASSFQITTDNTGAATIYEWSNIGFSSNQGAAVFNGFKVDTVNASNWTATSSSTWGAGFSGTVPDSDHAAANFGSIASAQTVTVEGSGRTVGVLDINSPNGYTFSGGTITMNDSFAPDPNLPQPTSPPPSVSNTTGHAQINVLGDSTFNVTHQISSPIVLIQQTSINTAQGNNLTITGQISSGSRGINKLGNGVLTLSANNSYGGTTNVFAGKLVVNGTHTGGGDYTLSNGTLAGSGTITLRDDIQPRGGASGPYGPQPGKVTAWNGSTIAPGDTGAVGTLAMDRLLMGSPAPHGAGSINLNIDIGPSGADKLNVTDTNGVAFDNATGTVLINVSALAGAVAGTFPILDYNGSILDASNTPVADISRFGLSSTTVGGFSLALINNTANTSIDLAVVVGAIGPSTWTGSTNANWSVSTNWSGIVPNNIDASAVFGTVASNQYAVNVDGPKTVGTMSFSGANSYSLSGSTITFQATNGAPAIVVGQGNHTIAAPVTINNFLFITTVAGASLNITGPVTATASGQEISVSGGGTTSFAQLSVGTLLVNAGRTKISAKATVGDPTGTTRIGTLSVAAGATFDVGNNFAILDATPVATVQSQIASAYANGAWTGTGISSSSAATIAANAGNTHKTALGYALASDINNFGTNPSFSFGGMTVTSGTSVLVRYTLAGDSNLDGVVNTSDFTALATNFSGSGKAWVQGDFNYDGKVNALDFNAVATNFGATPAPGAPLGSLVPEPSALLVLAPLMACYRKRKGSVYVKTM